MPAACKGPRKALPRSVPIAIKGHPGMGVYTVLQSPVLPGVLKAQGAFV